MPLTKPKGCEGCPFHTLSPYITPDYMIEGSEITILAQAPGKHEEEGSFIQSYEYRSGRREEITQSVNPQPLIGATGHWLRKDWWNLTKLDYSKISRANVIKCRPHGMNDLPNISSSVPVHGITVKMLKEAISHCTRTYLRIPKSTKYILSMGEVSLYALTGEELLNYRKRESSPDSYERSRRAKSSTVGEWRGWALGKERLSAGVSTQTHGLYNYYTPSPSYITIFPIIHLASLLENSSLYHATQYDFIRFGRLVRGEWPRSLPQVTINKLPTSIPSTIGFDTEYDPRTSELEMWSMADIQGNIWVVDAEYSRRLSNLPDIVNLITQNGLVDYPHFLPLVEGTDLRRVNMEDCMLAHTVKWPGEPYGLDYMLSKYGRYNRHKHLRTSHDRDTKYLYAGLDAHTTLLDAWRGLLQDFKSDPLAWEGYKKRRKPLLYPIRRFQERGVAIWTERVEYVGELLDKKMEELTQRARELTENPTFLLSSHDQVAQALYKGVYKKEKSESIQAKSCKSDSPSKRSSKASVKKVEELIEQLKLKLGVE